MGFSLRSTRNAENCSHPHACYLGGTTKPRKYIVGRVLDARIGPVQFAGCLRGEGGKQEAV
jgi:hypothetical protein